MLRTAPAERVTRVAAAGPTIVQPTGVRSSVAVTGYIGWLRDRVGAAPVQLNFAAACIVDEGNVLLQLRSEVNGWGLPGGAIELDESADEAAVREVREETGLEVLPDHLLGVYSKYRQSYPNGDVAQPITVIFVCEVRGGTLSDGDAETADLAWFPLDGLPHLWSSLHVDALADLRAGRRGVFR